MNKEEDTFRITNKVNVVTGWMYPNGQYKVIELDRNSPLMGLYKDTSKNNSKDTCIK